MIRIIDDPNERLWLQDELKHNQPELQERDLAEWLAENNFPAGIIIEREGRIYMSYPLQDEKYNCVILKECEFVDGNWLLLEDGCALFPSFSRDTAAQRAERKLADTWCGEASPLAYSREELLQMMRDNPLGEYHLRVYGEMRLFAD